MEERLHRPWRAPTLARVRNTAMSLVRWRRFRSIPDGWWWISAHPEVTIH